MTHKSNCEGIFSDDFCAQEFEKHFRLIYIYMINIYSFFVYGKWCNKNIYWWLNHRLDLAHIYIFFIYLLVFNRYWKKNKVPIVGQKFTYIFRNTWILLWYKQTQKFRRSNWWFHVLQSPTMASCADICYIIWYLKYGKIFLT